MLNKDALISVTNRGAGHVGYTVPDLGVKRQFMPNETKEISMEELRKLSYVSGGLTLIKNYLIIQNDEAVKELLGAVEPEYNYSDAEVKELLLNGSEEQLLDCLDFAPKGVIELIKDSAVKIELNDVHKRQIILEKTGFNVTRAIEINHESEADNDAPTSEKVRRAAPISTEENSRRVDPSKYKVTSISE